MRENAQKVSEFPSRKRFKKNELKRLYASVPRAKEFIKNALKREGDLEANIKSETDSKKKRKLKRFHITLTHILRL